MHTTYFEFIKIWQESTSVAYNLHQQLENHSFPDKEHLQESVIEIVTYISNFFENQTQPDVLQYLHTSVQHCADLKVQLLAAYQQNFISEAEMVPMLEKVRQILSMVYKAIQYKKNATHPFTTLSSFSNV